MEELLERAQRIDSENQLTNRNRDHYYNRPLFRKDQSNYSSSYHLKRDKDGDVQMIGAKVDLEKARQDKLCFNCGKQGHQARSCKAKKKDPSKIRMVIAIDNITDQNRKTIFDFEPIPGESDRIQSIAA